VSNKYDPASHRERMIISAILTLANQWETECKDGKQTGTGARFTEDQINMLASHYISLQCIANRFGKSQQLPELKNWP
jgi:hypothetical protein